MHTQKEILLTIVAASFLFFILISFIITIVRFHKRKQKDFQNELELVKANFEKELLKTQLEIQEETFQHISLELHDNVGHFLSLAKLHLTTVNGNLPAGLDGTLSDSVQLITCSIDEIRNISRSLNTENIKSIGLIKTVEQQVEQLRKSGLFLVHFTVTGKTCYLEDQVEIVLFRIFQESLNNIVRHSKATSIHVGLHFQEQQVELSIADDGVGFDIEKILESSQNRSAGLKNIIKRSLLINAVHKISSEPGSGTSIKIITPYLPANAR